MSHRQDGAPRFRPLSMRGPSECLADGDVELPRTLVLLPVELPAVLKTERADGGIDPETEPEDGAEVRGVEPGEAARDVAEIGEDDPPQGAPDRVAHFLVEDEERLAPDRLAGQGILGSHLVAAEPPDGGIAPREEA